MRARPKIVHQARHYATMNITYVVTSSYAAARYKKVILVAEPSVNGRYFNVLIHYFPGRLSGDRRRKTFAK